MTIITPSQSRLKNKLFYFTHYCPKGNGCDENDYIDLSGKMVLADFDNCTSTNYYWNGAECVREPDVTKRKCCDSCKDMGGWCNRIRYTPAEAAAAMNGDDNTVISTFRN